MGYESKIYFVVKSHYADTNGETKGKTYAQVVAMMDMCKCPDVRIFFRQAGEISNCYWYGRNDEPILRDEYGDPLREVSAEDFAAFLDKYFKEEKNEGELKYRRWAPLKALADAFAENNQTAWGGRLRVIHYGY